MSTDATPQPVLDRHRRLAAKAVSGDYRNVHIDAWAERGVPLPDWFSSLHEPVAQALADAERSALAAQAEEHARELAELRSGYESLDRNWAVLHSAGMNEIREALGMPDGSVPEMCERIAALRKATDVRPR